MKRSISLFLCLLLALVLLPAKGALADDRTVISTIVANSNVDQLPVCGQEIQTPNFTVTQGLPVRFSTNMGHWSKKEGENWVRYDSGVFTPGTWRYYTQFRIDGSSGTTHVLATNPTVRVNDVAWTVVGTSSVGTNYSYNNARSPEYTVTDNGELLFAVPGSVKISSCYVNEAITSFSVAQYVSGGTAPYTFSKSAESTCPSWVKVSATGTISGTPTAPYGRTSSLVIKVTDGSGNEKEASIVVAKVAVRYEDKTKISSIVATSNIGSILVNTGTIQDPTFTVTQGSPAYMNTNMGYWQKKNGDTWTKQTSGTFTPGTWRYYVQFRIDGEDGVSYTLDRTNVTVKVDGASWTVPWESTIDDLFSYNNAYSPEFTVTDELPIYAAAVTITAPAVGARPDYVPGLPSGAHYYSDSYNTTTYHNDVCWRNMTTGPSLSVDTGVFEAGYSYQAIIYLTADDGYFFIETATGTINGNAAEARLQNGQLQLKYTFPALPSKPVITGHPISATAAVGNTVTFRVCASGTGLSYAWQYKKPGETAWHDVSVNGATDTYNLTVAARHDGYVYRCQVSNVAGTVTSNTAKLTVLPKPVITKHPAAVTVDEGKTATFTVTASGIGMSYRWQYQKPGETGWRDVQTNGTSATYSLTAAARHNGYVYRCQVSNVAGTVTSNTAKLTVRSKPVITTQPAAVTVNEGQTATFKVVATGATGYKWQYQKPGETGWHDVSVNGTSATYNLTAAARHNGFQYRCQVTNAAGTVTSNTAKLTVKSKPVITTQPAAVAVNEGQTATFKVVATGATGYQWQYKKPGESAWRDVQSNGTSATYKLTTAARHNGYAYRCQVSNAAGTVTSGTAVLTVK